MDKIMHVMVSKPNESRKEILQSNIEVIRFLKANEKLRLIRKEKLLYIIYIKKEMRELKRLMQHLFEVLPEVKLPEKEKRMDKIEKQEKQIIEKPAKSSELDKLEQDIKSLQEKISKL